MTRADDRARGAAPDYGTMEQEIHDRRSRIDRTLNALRHRLALQPLKEQTMNRMTKSVNSGASSLGDMVRGNPIPLALIGLGVGWMLLSRSGMDQRIAHSQAMNAVRDRASSTARYARDTFYSATGSVRDTASHLYERASDATEQVSERAGHAMENVRGGTYDDRSGRPVAGRPPGRFQGGGTAMTSTVSRQVGRVTTSFWELVDDHPLVAGVMGAALGAAIGASIPSTRYEERWVGDYAGQVTDKAKDAAQDAIDRGTRAARAAAEAAREHATEAADDVKGAAKEEINRPT
ncbi:MAG TPA: hypothetical protein VD978_15670 [Azospirillum sp.]|nr:hypothetical protein [Azospirillum sp.]